MLPVLLFSEYQNNTFYFCFNGNIKYFLKKRITWNLMFSGKQLKTNGYRSIHKTGN